MINEYNYKKKHKIIDLQQTNKICGKKKCIKTNNTKRKLKYEILINKYKKEK